MSVTALRAGAPRASYESARLSDLNAAIPGGLRWRSGDDQLLIYNPLRGETNALRVQGRHDRSEPPKVITPCGLRGSGRVR
jgi:hypothetical protein